MPITEHEKQLRVHSRSSSDLAAVPFKKRRFHFPSSPSPPPESPSPIPADCGIPENKAESSELEPPCSKAGGDSSCESCDLQPLTPADCGIPEKKPESSNPWSPFCNPAEMNVNTGNVASHESSESPYPSPVSLFSISGNDHVQGNAVKGEDASCEPCELPPANCGIPEKKPESSQPWSHFSTRGTPAQENAMTCDDAPCEPSELPSPTPADRDISENKLQSSECKSLFSETGGNPAQVNSVTGKDASSEACEEPMNRDLNMSPKLEINPTFNDQGSGLNLGANSLNITDNMQEMVLGNKCATWPVTGSAVISSINQTFDAPGGEGSVEGKFTPIEGISMKQEQQELQNLQSKPRDTKVEADFSKICPSRSNWDLNTTMDAWEGSNADSSLNNGTAAHDRRDLGGIQNKGPELELKQNLFKEHSVTDVTLGNQGLQKYDQHLKLPNPCTSMVDSNSEASLGLHLKPSFLCNPSVTSGKHEAIRDTPFLSLGTKPMLSIVDSPLAIGKTVKSEPTERDQKDTGKVQLGIPKSIDLKHVKSELSEGQEVSKTTVFSNLNLACSGPVKTEPLEYQSQGYVRSPEGTSFHKGQKSLPQSTLMHQNAGIDNSKALNVESKPQVLNSLLHTCTKRPDISISNDSCSMVDKAQDLVNRAPLPGNEICTTITQDSNVLAAEPSILVSKSLISNGHDTNLLAETCETPSLPIALLPESLTSNTSKAEEDIPAEGASEFALPEDPSDAPHLSNATLTDEILRNPCENSKVAESDEVEGKVGVVSEILGGPCDGTCKSGNSCVAAGAKDMVRKQGGKNNEDFEDGEVRDPAVNGTVEGPCELTEGQQVKASNSVSPVDVPVSMLLLVDDKDIKVETSKEANVFGSKESDGDLLDDKGKSGSSAVVAPTIDSGKKSLSKIIRKTPKDHSKNDKGLQKNIKSCDLSTKTDLPDSQSHVTCSEHQNAGGPTLAENYVSRKAEPSEKGGATKDANDRGNHRRIIYLNSPTNCLASGKRKSTLDRSMSCRGEREKPVDRPCRAERSGSRGSRDESSNERSRKGESERHYGHPMEKCRSDLMPIRRNEWPNALHGDRNSNHDHLLEQINSSSGGRYSRPINEVASGAFPDGSSRMGRKLTNEEMQNLSRLPCQRRSPGGRVQIPFGRHPVRDISPSRCIGREVPDFVLLAHEEKLSRNLPEDLVEQSMISHPRSQYERAEGILIRRERRSLSPSLRRGGPLQLPPNGPQSSPRSQQRTTHQWSPQRRPSDGFSDTRELMRHRSPPIMRLNRMQSPHERPCFPEEVIARRRGSPPYIGRLPNDVADVGPSREDFPRPVRGPNRNMRRFNMIDPREIMEEEYFDPPLVQIREFGVDDEFVEDRMCVERRGPIRSFRQRFIAGDRENEIFHFHAGDGPPRGSRLRPDANDGFPEGSGPRDFDVRFRNRLGNSSGRLRGIVEEQEDNYRHHGEQEWRDPAFNDARPKRRRF